MDDKKKVKNMMWEDKDIIQENTSKRLFGEKFDEKITEHNKVRKKSRKFFKIIDNKQPNNSINNVNNHQPFRRNPLPQQDMGGGKVISLAIIKTTTDRATELVSQNLNLPSFVYPVLANARISKST